VAVAALAAMLVPGIKRAVAAGPVAVAELELVR
jgi:hypothetical protein